MQKIWKKQSQKEIKTRIYKALESNINFKELKALGVPASYLDQKVFSQENFILQDAPFISTLVNNPNHIGCHTSGESESYFSGTQSIERELINICSVDILGGEYDQQDGYVSSGGTEANLQAIWIYRNYFMQHFNANLEEICVLCSEDSHYSMDKGSDMFVVDIYKVPLIEKTRKITRENLSKVVKLAKSQKKKYFIIVSNMMTTMFGATDDVRLYSSLLKEEKCEFKIHIDAAFGGFYYPFSNKDSTISFKNINIDSFTLDAHKMAQAPYGTGIFLIRKGYIQYANTKSASYVEGEDCTLIGSRSGANVIAVWMILVSYGPHEWFEKIFLLQKRTDWMCEELNGLGANYFRDKNSNIISFYFDSINEETVKEFGLIPDKHSNPKWYKLVVMEHVTVDALLPLIEKIKQFLN